MRKNIFCIGLQNMGDVLIRDIIADVIGWSNVRYTSSAHLSNFYAIGSGLKKYEYKGSYKNKAFQYVCGRLLPDLTVWGAGFISYSDNDMPFYKRNIKFAALRGELTKKRVENIIGRELDIPLADPGLLASRLLKEPVEKRYDVGIIAHFREQDEPAFKRMMDYYPNSTFIDIKGSPSTVIKAIATCKCIISSSLHGLITADSLGIPNIHTVVSDKLRGDGYKFDDYYSAFNVKHPFIDGNGTLPSLDWIKSSYCIDNSVVKYKQKQLVDAVTLKKSHIIQLRILTCLVLNFFGKESSFTYGFIIII